jgi:biofilm protein TabA
MIHDAFENVGLYAPCCKPLHRAIEIAQILWASPNEKLVVDNETMYIVVNSYTTKSPEDVPFEAHRKYIDVQILLSGRERIEVARQENLTLLHEYDENIDAMFYAPPAVSTSILLEPGQFVVLFPHDAHRPGLFVDAPVDVQKLVIKIRV